MRPVEIRLAARVLCRGQKNIVRAVQDGGGCQSAVFRMYAQFGQKVQGDADATLPTLLCHHPGSLHPGPIRRGAQRYPRGVERTGPPCAVRRDVDFYIGKAALGCNEKFGGVVLPQLLTKFSAFPIRVGMDSSCLARTKDEVFVVRCETVRDGWSNRVAEPFAIQLLSEGCGYCTDDTLHRLYTNTFRCFFKIIPLSGTLENSWRTNFWNEAESV